MEDRVRIEVSPLQKTESPDCCITIARTCYKEGKLVDEMLRKQYCQRDVFSGQMDLTYDKIVYYNSSFKVLRQKKNLALN